MITELILLDKPANRKIPSAGKLQILCFFRVNWYEKINRKV